MKSNRFPSAGDGADVIGVDPVSEFSALVTVWLLRDVGTQSVETRHIMLSPSDALKMAAVLIDRAVTIQANAEEVPPCS